MTSHERMANVWNCRPADRVPFIPAVYEQKAFLIDDTPSNVSRDAELFYRAMMVEHETYQADAMIIGMDVYNIEAEAMGSTVKFYEGDDTSIPGISSGNHAITFGDDLSQLKIPNPARDSRMPVNLEVARRLSKLHRTVPVRGALSAPFSLALSVAGVEEFFMGTVLDPDYCRRLMDICAGVVIEFGKAYLDQGVGLVMFDSQASPDLLSPDVYRDMVLPVTQRVNAELFEAGEEYCPLIIGGNTTAMLDSYVNSGTKQILCDFTADFSLFRSACEEHGLSLRRNINPLRVQKGTVDEMTETATAYLKDAEGMNGFIMGTAVVPFGSPTENIVAIREVCETRGQTPS